MVEAARVGSLNARPAHQLGAGEDSDEVQEMHSQLERRWGETAEYLDRKPCGTR